ncbi:MAG: hypothetical protein RL726_623, partial [Actinomycetota bacterium]
LLDAPCPAVSGGYGGGCIPSSLRNTFDSVDPSVLDGRERTAEQGSFGFVDTLPEYGGALWTFDSKGMTRLSNQYAAMPSMHIGWSSWCAFAMWPLLRRRWTKIAMLLYPAATLFCIVVTGNHFWIDGIGGQLALAIGVWGGWRLHRWNTQRLDVRHDITHGIERPARPA